MKNYVLYRATNASFSLDTMADEPGIPSAPVVTDGPSGHPLNRLGFGIEPYQGEGSFRSVQWRVAEISRPGHPATTSLEPMHYEMEAVWQSPEIVELGSDSRFRGDTPGLVICTAYGPDSWIRPAAQVIGQIRWSLRPENRRIGRFGAGPRAHGGDVQSVAGRLRVRGTAQPKLHGNTGSRGCPPSRPGSTLYSWLEAGWGRAAMRLLIRSSDDGVPPLAWSR